MLNNTMQTSYIGSSEPQQSQIIATVERAESNLNQAQALLSDIEAILFGPKPPETAKALKQGGGGLLGALHNLEDDSDSIGNKLKSIRERLGEFSYDKEASVGQIPVSGRGF